MARAFMKGNEAVAEAVIRGGVDLFAGYPITPSSEMLEYASDHMADIGAKFIQVESELAASTMLSAAGLIGRRAFTTTAGPGLALMTENLSNMILSRVTALFIVVQRAANNITPEQADYNYATKGFGHNGQRGYVIAPSTVQEAVDLAYTALDKGQELEVPVLFMMDGMLGQMEEPVELPPYKESKRSATVIPPTGCAGRQKIDSRSMPRPQSYTETMEDALERARNQLFQENLRWVDEEVKYDEYMMDDAEYVIVSYGSSARIMRDAVKLLREKGVKAGLFRPITLFPFPEKQIAGLQDRGVKGVLTVEMAIPPMLHYDVKMHLDRSIPCQFYNRCGGNTVDEYEAVEAMEKLIQEVQK